MPRERPAPVRRRGPPRAAAEASYGVLTAGTAHAIVLCAAIRWYTRSPAQSTPGSRRRGVSPQVAGEHPEGGDQSMIFAVMM